MIDTVIAPTPIEVVTPIKPSEAIRLGILLAPVQAFDDFEDGPGTACAVGAMNLGFGDPVDTQFPVSRRGGPTHLVCPDCGELGDATIGELNDDHRWSRERIADWLEGLGL